MITPKNVTCADTLTLYTIELPYMWDIIGEATVHLSGTVRAPFPQIDARIMKAVVVCFE